MTLRSEIFEQPDVLRNLLGTQMNSMSEIARQVAQWNPAYIFLAARGTSDNAGRYAQYLLGSFNRMPIALATPSLFSLYQTPPQLTGALVVGISQSGQSPDIVGVLEEGKKQGCPTLAITNDINSPLARIADAVINVQAGAEKAVAATKTYTGELMAIAMLSAALGKNAVQTEILQKVPGWIEQLLAKEADIARLAERYQFMTQCVVLGRGFNYATAFEWSLKMKELTYVAAEAYSSADFQHGPVAVVEHGYPVMAVMPDGQVFENMMDFLVRLRSERSAELLVLSNRLEALELAQSKIALPTGMPEWISPLVSIVPAQLFCYYLTQAKGYNPEKPRGLNKVTETH